MGEGQDDSATVKERHKPMIALVDRRLAELQSSPAGLLRAMPECVETKVEVNGRPARINVFNEDDDSGSRRIIVQGIQESLSDISAHVVPRGFKLLSDGSTRPLREDEMYEFT